MIYVAIGGSRYFTSSDEAVIFNWLNYYLQNLLQQDSITIVNGGCRGCDLIAQKWANLNGCSVLTIVPDWNQGLKAGPLRNKELIKASDFVIAFLKEGEACRGTHSLISEAKKAGKPLRIKKI